MTVDDRILKRGLIWFHKPNGGDWFMNLTISKIDQQLKVLVLSSNKKIL